METLFLRKEGSKVVGNLVIRLRYPYSWDKYYGKHLYHKLTLEADGVHLVLGSKWVHNHRTGDLKQKAVEYVQNLLKECAKEVGKDVVAHLPHDLIRRVCTGREDVRALRVSYKKHKKLLNDQELWLTFGLQVAWHE